MGIYIVTGATGSMGHVATKSLAQEGHSVIMACRNLEKGKAVRDGIVSSLGPDGDSRVILLPLDLTSRASVRQFVNSVEKYLSGGQADTKKLTGLFNNAGVLSRDYVIAEDGLERTMSVNYLNTAMLTLLLLPYIEDGGNITCMVSLTTKFASIDTLWPNYPPSRYSQLGTYAMSKLALLYFAIGLARHNPRLHINVSDPGVVNSNMITMGRWFDPLADVLFRPFISSPEKGVAPALASLRCKESLLYFVGLTSRPIGAKYLNSPLVDQLWDQLAVFFPPDLLG